MFFGTNKKLSIFFLSRLNQLYHRFIITVMLLLNFSKRCKFALTISFFFLLENIELVCIFDGHFVLEVIGLNNWLFFIFPSRFEARKVFIRWVVSALLLLCFYSSFNFRLYHYRILLFATFVRIFRCIWMYWVIIILSIFSQMVHYFRSSKSTFFRLFPFRFSWGVGVNRIIIMVPRKRNLRLRIWWYTNCILFWRVLTSIRFVVRLLSVTFWILRFDFF